MDVDELGPDSQTPMHHTDTLDLQTVLSRSVDLVLDDGAHRLDEGDLVVLAGVDHAWRGGPTAAGSALSFSALRHRRKAISPHRTENIGAARPTTRVGRSGRRCWVPITWSGQQPIDDDFSQPLQDLVTEYCWGAV